MSRTSNDERAARFPRLLQQIQRLEKIQCCVSALRGCPPNVSIELNYEQFCTAPGQQFDRLPDLLETNVAHDPETAFYQIPPNTRLEDILENYSGVRSQIIADGFETVAGETAHCKQCCVSDWKSGRFSRCCRYLSGAFELIHGAPVTPKS